MNEQRRRLALGIGFVVVGLAAVAQGVLAAAARTWSVAWWATLVGGSVSAVAGVFAARDPGRGSGNDERPLTFWTAVAGVVLSLVGTVLILV